MRLHGEHGRLEDLFELRPPAVLEQVMEGGENRRSLGFERVEADRKVDVGGIEIDDVAAAATVE